MTVNDWTSAAVGDGDIGLARVDTVAEVYSIGMIAGATRSGSPATGPPTRLVRQAPSKARGELQSMYNTAKCC